MDAAITASGTGSAAVVEMATFFIGTTRDSADAEGSVAAAEGTLAAAAFVLASAKTLVTLHTWFGEERLTFQCVRVDGKLDGLRAWLRAKVI